LWFPEYNHIVGDVDTFSNSKTTSTDDILFAGYYDAKGCFRKLGGDRYKLLRFFFPGKVLFINTESKGRIPQIPNFYQIGSPIDHRYPSYNSLPNILYGVGFLWSAGWPSVEQIIDPTRRPQWNGKSKKILYLSSHCVSHRQEAAKTLANAFFTDNNNNDNLEYGLDSGGKCLVPDATNVRRQFEFGWARNRVQYQNYKYCLVVENSEGAGYITEKLINAYLGGCLPIYWGGPMEGYVYEVFNRNSFVYYDMENPQATIGEIRYLNGNDTAYWERLQAPILANNRNATIREYFSYTDSVGDGYLKGRMRAMLGVEE
jgi:hypothetical protein